MVLERSYSWGMLSALQLRFSSLALPYTYMHICSLNLSQVCKKAFLPAGTPGDALPDLGKTVQKSACPLGGDSGLDKAMVKTQQHGDPPSFRTFMSSERQRSR